MSIVITNNPTSTSNGDDVESLTSILHKPTTLDLAQKHDFVLNRVEGDGLCMSSDVDV